MERRILDVVSGMILALALFLVYSFFLTGTS